MYHDTQHAQTRCVSDQYNLRQCSIGCRGCVIIFVLRGCVTRMDLPLEARDDRTLVASVTGDWDAQLGLVVGHNTATVTVARHQ